MTDLAARVEKLTRKTEGCWYWTGSVDKNGYALLRIEGRIRRLARYLFQLESGVKLPESLHVLHDCDNPACIKIAHLFVGTHAENMADMAQKGRANKPVGELNGRAVLTKDVVLRIREDAAAGLSHGALVEKYNAPRGAVYHVISGRSWL